MAMALEIELRKLASLFDGRIDNNSLTLAVDDLNHGENCLALETLCDQLCEEDVALSLLEYQEFLRLGTPVGADLKAGRIKYLKNLSAHP
jgi:hypothetical protein